MPTFFFITTVVLPTLQYINKMKCHMLVRMIRKMIGLNDVILGEGTRTFSGEFPHAFPGTNQPHSQAPEPK